MKQLLGLSLFVGIEMTLPAFAGDTLRVSYPSNGHQTTAERIFLIGTAPTQGDVTVNGQVIRDRSPSGNFAPSLPLKLGNNPFSLRYQDQTLTLNIERIAVQTSPPGDTFAPDSLTPAVDVARLPQEPICFSAIAPTNATVAVQLGHHTIPLHPQTQVILPQNSAALIDQTQPTQSTTQYHSCTAFTTPGLLGQPWFQLQTQGKSLKQRGPGAIAILSPAEFKSIAVTQEQGVARTGPSTDHARLTPLPQGTQARVTGREGEWLRLDYGGWIKATETQPLPSGTWPQAVIRSFRSRSGPGWTEVSLPLTVPVPVTVDQGDRTFTLTLHNTTAQTDINVIQDDPIISRLDWQQVAPGQVQYRFTFKSSQQWGYKLRYDGTTLVLSLRHPPQPQSASVLSGVKILLDPGHGSQNDLGSVGPTGVPEKDVTLAVSQRLQAELKRRGATVSMTREGDDDLFPQDRVAKINEVEPAIALSIHYNALPDSGDAINTAGIGTFWYHAQSHDLAAFLYHHLIETLNRPAYGIFWDNLALTRPTVAPAVLLELGFMINPTEFEWIIDPQAQQQLARRLADGIEAWVEQKVKP